MTISHEYRNTIHTLSEFQIITKEEVNDVVGEDYEKSTGMFGSPTYKQAYKVVGVEKYTLKLIYCPLCERNIEVARVYHS